jgi:hypothetical protein
MNRTGTQLAIQRKKFKETGICSPEESERHAQKPARHASADVTFLKQQAQNFEVKLYEHA